MNIKFVITSIQYLNPYSVYFKAIWSRKIRIYLIGFDYIWLFYLQNALKFFIFYKPTLNNSETFCQILNSGKIFPKPYFSYCEVTCWFWCMTDLTMMIKKLKSFFIFCFLTKTTRIWNFFFISSTLNLSYTWTKLNRRHDAATTLFNWGYACLLVICSIVWALLIFWKCGCNYDLFLRRF